MLKCTEDYKLVKMRFQVNIYIYIYRFELLKKTCCALNSVNVLHKTQALTINVWVFFYYSTYTSSGFILFKEV